MRHRLARAALGVVLLAAAGCGDGPEAPALDVRDPGAGTGALLVQAYVKGTATAPNALDPAAFRTRLLVHVSRRGRPVLDAAVRVNGVALVHRALGLYVEPVELAGPPPPVVALDVTAGGDWLRAAVASPGVHVFTRPSRSGEVLAWAAGAPLGVAWGRGLRADSAALNVGAFAADGDIDDGAFAIPAGAAGAGPADCGLLRENRVRLAGGAAGSLLSVSIWNGLDVALQPR